MSILRKKILKIQKDEKVFILSIHNPTSQIWLSSPLSGAHHFEMENNTKKWTDTRDKKIESYRNASKGTGFTKMSEKLLKLFKVDNYLRLFIVFIVFGITGSLSVILGKYVLITFFTSEIMNNEFYWLIRILLIFPLYQILLIIVGTLFGEFKYFWAIEKKILVRLKIIKSPPS